jgi:hypothetical protein
MLIGFVAACIMIVSPLKIFLQTSSLTTAPCGAPELRLTATAPKLHSNTYVIYAQAIAQASEATQTDTVLVQ